nr:hypothetical protein CFP56_65170 [Quercus suber]
MYISFSLKSSFPPLGFMCIAESVGPCSTEIAAPYVLMAGGADCMLKRDGLARWMPRPGCLTDPMHEQTQTYATRATSLRENYIQHAIEYLETHYIPLSCE